MAWTAPRTWVTNEVVTAANMNTHVRDNLSYLKGETDKMAEFVIDSTELSGDTASVTFTSISASYDILRLAYEARTDNAATSDSLLLTFNNDTGNNYYYIINRLLETNHIASAVRATSSIVLACTGANSPANSFACWDIFIFSYKDTDTDRTIRGRGGWFYDSTTDAGLESLLAFALWDNSADAISEIDLVPSAGSNIKQYSKFQLSGILAA